MDADQLGELVLDGHVGQVAILENVVELSDVGEHLELLPLACRGGRRQLDAPQHFTEHHAHLHHRETRTETTAIPAAEPEASTKSMGGQAFIMPISIC